MLCIIPHAVWESAFFGFCGMTLSDIKGKLNTRKGEASHLNSRQTNKIWNFHTFILVKIVKPQFSIEVKFLMFWNMIPLYCHCSDLPFITS